MKETGRCFKCNERIGYTTLTEFRQTVSPKINGGA
jgi:hypothetical protein